MPSLFTNPRDEFDIDLNARLLGLGSPRGAQADSINGNPTANLNNALSKKIGLNDFSIHTVIKDDDFGDSTHYQDIFLSNTAGNSRVYVYFWAATGALTMTWIDSGGSSTSFTLATEEHFPTGQWLELFVSVDRDGLAKTYVNRSLVGSVDVSSVAGIDIGASNANVGAIFGAGSSSSEFTGSMAVFRIFNLALTEAQVLDISQNGVPWTMRHNSFADIIAPGTLNGGFETAGGGGADVFANWVESAAGSSSVNNETVDVVTGSDACRLDVDASDSLVGVYQSSLTSLVNGRLYNIGLQAKIDDAAGGPHLEADNGSSVTYATITLTTAYKRYNEVFTATDPLVRFVRWFGGGTDSDSIYIDDVYLTPAGCILDLDMGYGRGHFFPDRSPNQWNGVGNAFTRPLSNDVTPIRSRTYAASLAFDMNQYRGQVIRIGDLTGNLAITTSNWRIGDELTLLFKDDGTGRTLTLPSWVGMNAALPASTTAGKWNILTLKSTSTTDGGVLAFHTEQP